MDIDKKRGRTVILPLAASAVQAVVVTKSIYF